MNLVILKLDLKQQGTATLFGIDQSDVTDYVKFGLPVLKAILPTAEKSRKWIAAPERTDEEIRKLLKNFRIKWDGTHNPVENSPDKEERKTLYGRKKRPTRTTTIACNDDDYTIYKGKSHPKSTHDITALHEEDPDLGRITKSMKDPNTPKQYRVNAFLDSGCQKAQEKYPGVNMHIVKKKPKNGQLIDAEKAHNKWISKRRNGVEHTIAHHKDWRVLENRWTGTAEKFDDTFDVVTGLSNLKVALNNPRYKNILDGLTGNTSDLSRPWDGDQREQYRMNARSGMFG